MRIYLSKIFDEKRIVLNFIILIVLLAIICTPRWDRQDLGIVAKLTGNNKTFVPDTAEGKLIKHSIDSWQYSAIVKNFRGEANNNKLLSPYTYRVLPTYLASLLPFQAITSLNIINFMSIIGILIILGLILRYVGVTFKYRIIGLLLFIVSFPTFYYASVGMIDPTIIFVITLGTYAIIRNNNLSLFIIIIVGSFVKESVIILIGVNFIYNYFNKRSIKVVISHSIIYLLAYLVATYFSRIIISIDEAYLWNPSMGTLIGNLSRPRTYLSFALTFGIPGALSVIAIAKMATLKASKPIIYTLIAGVSLSLMLFLYSLLAAYSDGRFVWIAYPYAIPLAVLLLQSKSQSK